MEDTIELSKNTCLFCEKTFETSYNIKTGDYSDVYCSEECSVKDTEKFRQQKQQELLEYFSFYLPYNTKIRQKNFKSNYNGNEFGILNGIYPLGKSSDIQNKYWQFTTDNNSTGQSLKDGILQLRPIEYLDTIDTLELSNITNKFSLIQKVKSHANNNILAYRDFAWLLKNHIDIFGLAEKGLAEYIQD